MRHAMVLLSTLLIILTLWFSSPAYALSQAQEVSVAQTSQGDVYQRVGARGTITEGQVYRAAAKGSLRVHRVLVSPGDEVEAGQALMEVEYYISGNAAAAYSQQAQDLLDAAAETFGVSQDELEEMAGDLLKDLPSVPATATLSGTTEFLRAGIGGTVTGVSCGEGDDVASGATCVTVSDLSQLQVELNIPEAMVSQVEVGMICNVNGEAFDKTYTGIVTEISPTAKQASSLTDSGATTVSASVKIRRPQGLRPGYSASVTIFTQMRRDALLVPYEALQQDEENQEFVFVYADGFLYKRAVETGFEQSDSIEVVAGLAPGETVVLNPGENFYTGMRATERAG